MSFKLILLLLFVNILCFYSSEFISYQNRTLIRICIYLLDTTMHNKWNLVIQPYVT